MKQEMLSVRADQVLVGDELYNRYGAKAHPAFAWVRVKAVERSEDGKHVILRTSAWDTWLHPAEGIGVCRWSEA